MSITGSRAVLGGLKARDGELQMLDEQTPDNARQEVALRIVGGDGQPVVVHLAASDLDKLKAVLQYADKVLQARRERAVRNQNLSLL